MPSSRSGFTGALPRAAATNAPSASAKVASRGGSSESSIARGVRRAVAIAAESRAAIRKSRRAGAHCSRDDR